MATIKIIPELIPATLTTDNATLHFAYLVWDSDDMAGVGEPIAQAVLSSYLYLSGPLIIEPTATIKLTAIAELSNCWYRIGLDSDAILLTASSFELQNRTTQVLVPTAATSGLTGSAAIIASWHLELYSNAILLNANSFDVPTVNDTACYIVSFEDYANDGTLVLPYEEGQVTLHSSMDLPANYIQAWMLGVIQHPYWVGPHPVAVVRYPREDVVWGEEWFLRFDEYFSTPSYALASNSEFPSYYEIDCSALDTIWIGNMETQYGVLSFSSSAELELALNHNISSTVGLELVTTLNLNINEFDPIWYDEKCISLDGYKDQIILNPTGPYVYPFELGQDWTIFLRFRTTHRHQQYIFNHDANVGGTIQGCALYISGTDGNLVFKWGNGSSFEYLSKDPPRVDGGWASGNWYTVIIRCRGIGDRMYVAFQTNLAGGLSETFYYPMLDMTADTYCTIGYRYGDPIPRGTQFDNDFRGEIQVFCIWDSAINPDIMFNFARFGFDFSREFGTYNNKQWYKLLAHFRDDWDTVVNVVDPITGSRDTWEYTSSNVDDISFIDIDYSPQTYITIVVIQRGSGLIEANTGAIWTCPATGEQGLEIGYVSKTSGLDVDRVYLIGGNGVTFPEGEVIQREDGEYGEIYNVSYKDYTEQTTTYLEISTSTELSASVDTFVLRIPFFYVGDDSGNIVEGDGYYLISRNFQLSTLIDQYGNELIDEAGNILVGKHYAD